MPMQPHLIHIGFPKCASTFLQAWFAAHPQIKYKFDFFGGIGGAVDLVDHNLTEPNPRICRVTSCELLSVPNNSSPAYYFVMPEPDLQRAREIRICAELAAMFPAAKILIVTRNQHDLLVSACSELIKHGGDDIAAFLGQFETEHFRTASPFDFGRALKLYQKYFPGRVLAMPYELMVDDRTAFLNAIAAFIGVDAFDIPDSRVNSSLTPEQLYWYPRIARLIRRVPSWRIASRLLAIHRTLIARDGWRVPLKLLRRFFGPKATRVTIPAALEGRLKIDCEALLASELYAPYRERYRGSVPVAAES